MKNIYISYEDLVEQNFQGYILYSEKLKTIEWSTFRQTILQRDSYICQKCKIRHSKIIDGIPYINYTDEEEQNLVEKYHIEFDNFQKSLGMSFPIPNFEKILHQDYHPKYLHVHHKYYIKNALPWNYPDDALISVCGKCHQEIHDTEDIPVYSSESKNEKLSLTKCSRCNGSGHLKEYHYYMNGICFKCNGNEFEEKW